MDPTNLVASGNTSWIIWAIVLFFAGLAFLSTLGRRRGGTRRPVVRGAVGHGSGVGADADPESFQLTSSAFPDEGVMPAPYTGESPQNLSPPLAWLGAPAESRQFALLCEDPDAPQDEPFVHWLIYNIPASTTILPEGLPAQGHFEQPVEAVQGLNSFGRIGYSGPLPPIGDDWHRYYFTLFALDEELVIPPGATKDDLFRALTDHVIGEAQLVGKYKRGVALHASVA